jgi:photosystem II stability/assembly factor-like uncharacterized protein
LKRLSFGLCLLSGIVPANSPAQAPRWQPIGISSGGGMFTPAISPADPNLMMLNCDMSAAYISEDGGRNWRMIHHAQLRSDTACRPAFHPTDPNIIYASSGGRLKISRDRGRTFAAIGHLKDSLGGEIAINPSDPKIILAGSRSGRCWLSRDAGETCAACPGPTGQVIAFHFDHTRQGHSMVAATERGIWRSDDDGQTWSEKTQGLPWKEIQGFASGSDAAKKLVMLYCSIRSRDENGMFRGGLYRSRDRGETWESAMGQGPQHRDEASGPVGLWFHCAIQSTARDRREAAYRLCVQHQHRLSPAAQRHGVSQRRRRANIARDLLPGSAFPELQRRAGLGNRLVRAMFQGRRDAVRLRRAANGEAGGCWKVLTRPPRRSLMR